MRKRRYPAPRPKDFYLEYLESLIAKRRAEGRPPAPDIYDERLRNEALKDQPLKKAA